MTSTLAAIVISTSLISFISFIGIFALLIKEKLLDKIILGLVALSAGALMGSAFLHLMPEAAELFGNFNFYIYVLLGFILFFFIEKVLHWRHCHKEHCEVHAFAYMNIIGDVAHNLIDGLIIAASFVANINLGIVTTIAVAIHEIPQEIGDFGVMIHGGFKRTKALFLNFITAVTAVVGGIAGYYLASYSNSFLMFLLPFAAGGFLYIAASDLIPEIRKETRINHSFAHFGIFILGILIMYLI